MPYAILLKWIEKGLVVFKEDLNKVEEKIKKKEEQEKLTSWSTLFVLFIFSSLSQAEKHGSFYSKGNSHFINFKNISKFLFTTKNMRGMNGNISHIKGNILYEIFINRLIKSWITWIFISNSLLSLHSAYMIEKENTPHFMHEFLKHHEVLCVDISH